MLFLEPDQARTDAIMNKVLGWIAARYSAENCVSLEESYKALYATNLYEELMNYDNDLHYTDPLALYKMFVSELEASSTPLGIHFGLH